MHNNLQLFLVAVFVSLTVTINVVEGAAMVTGSVFCDQCKDGELSLFDYPLSGANVAMICPGSGGQMTLGEKTTNMLGSYVMTFDGTPDLSSCFTQITGHTNQDEANSCGASSGPPKSVRLMFSMFDMATYTVEPLISQPQKPMSFCSNSELPPTPTPTIPTPFFSNPPPTTPLPSPTTPKLPTPAFTLPPLPKLPPLPPMPKFPPLPPMPPLPFTQASACPYQYWAMDEYKCYWRAVSPETKVGLIFGPLAVKKYGTELTLRNGLQGKGDPYRTLLRETITALLNSYNSFSYTYNPLEVFQHFNTALTASNRSVLLTALHFKRANSGHGTVPCKFTTCN